MFQKLYKHLEDINASIREKEGETVDANQVRGKILEQLQQLNDSIRLREERLLSVQRTLARYMGIGSGLVIVCTAVLIFIDIRLRPATALRSAPTATYQTTRPAFATPTAEDVRYRENVQKLDTLVAEQAKSLKELTTLNRSAVYSLRRIRKYFAEQDKQASPASQGPDSLIKSSSLRAEKVSANGPY